jgi:hypothetical protein
MQLVRLTIHEMYIAQKLAERRDTGKTARQSRQRSPVDRRAIHMAGAMAEIAFGNVVGLVADFSKRKHGDAGHDFVLRSGATVDVKCRIVKSDAVRDAREFDLMSLGNTCDLYVLCTVEETALYSYPQSSTVFIHGWTRKEELEIKDFGYGATYTRRNGDLHAIEAIHHE